MELCYRCDKSLKKYEQFASVANDEIIIECYNCFYDIDEDDE